MPHSDPKNLKTSTKNPPLDRCICAEVRKAARALTNIYDDYLRPTGLRVTQFALLMAIKVRGSATVTKLAQVVLTDRTTLARNLAILEKKGLIAILPGEDKRERCVTLTDEGKRLCVESLPSWQKAQDHVTTALGEENVHSILAAISSLKSLARST